MPAIDFISYPDLYGRWEAAPWSANAIDFTQDHEDWAQMTQDQRDSVLWIASLFYVGEDEVTDTLAPFLKALWQDDQRYVLTTQQVDEARHSVFFRRFFSEVLGADAEKALTRASAQAFAQGSFRRVFRHLRHVTGELDRNPSLHALVRASATYHLVVEATLAHPGQGFLRDCVCDGRLPGLREGLERVAADEHRHIAFGMRVLYDAMERDPSTRQTLLDTLALLLPDLVGVFEPPRPEMITVFGSTQHEVVETGLRSLLSRLNVLGVELPDWVLPLDGAPDEMAHAALQLHAALSGQDTGSEAVERMISAMVRSLRTARPLCLGLNIDGVRRTAVVGPTGAGSLRTGGHATVWLHGSAADLRAAIANGQLLGLRPSGDPRGMVLLVRGVPRLYGQTEMWLESLRRRGMAPAEHLWQAAERRLRRDSRRLIA